MSDLKVTLLETIWYYTLLEILPQPPNPETLLDPQAEATTTELKRPFSLNAEELTNLLKSNNIFTYVAGNFSNVKISMAKLRD
jgi:hypothetical protein